MRQLLFLLLFPAFVVAQYPGNANQKITLGEQTTADGLVWRGRLADTANLLTNKLDTSVYIVLDTGTRAMWYYQASTTPKWTRLVDSLNNLQGQLSLTSKVTGTLPVANGGTNTSTAFTAGSVVFAGASGTYTQDNSGLFYDNTNDRLGIGTTSPTATLDVRGEINQKAPGNVSNIFESTTSTGRFIQSYSNDVGAAFQQGVYGSNNSQTLFGKTANNIAFIYTTTFVSTHPSVFAIGTYGNQDLILGTNNTQRILIQNGGAVTINNLAGSGDRTVLADANGLLSAPTSSIMTKENVQVLNYGLNEILQINPVSFDYIDKNKWGDERKLGFIVEDMYPIIPEVTGTMNNGDMYLDMVKLIPVLTKAIQEQQALIKALEQRILILENK